MEGTAAVVRTVDSPVVAVDLRIVGCTVRALVCSRAPAQTDNFDVVAVLVACRVNIAGMADRFCHNTIAQSLDYLRNLGCYPGLDTADIADYILDLLQEGTRHTLAAAVHRLAVEGIRRRGYCLAARRRYFSSW